MATPSEDPARKDAQVLQLANNITTILDRFARAVQAVGPADPTLLMAMMGRLEELARQWRAQAEEHCPPK